jgi:chorismate lyase/3-hydroxybenzoate synthase
VILATIRFGDGGLAIPPLDSATAEVWQSRLPVTNGECDGVTFAHNGEVLFGMFSSTEDDLEVASRGAYDAMVSVSRNAGYPFFLRVWNHVRDLNCGDGETERYKRFSAGRHESLTAAGFTKFDFPAACAVGMRAGNLAIHFLAARERGRNVENPRQVSAYDYPLQYGRRSPSFARATIAADGSVFISGTASVVGHETRHAGDADAQARETIANLARIATECGRAIEEAQLVKIYVRRASDAPRIIETFRKAIANASLIVLESDICRADLLLEAEATILDGKSSVSVDVTSRTV